LVIQPTDVDFMYVNFHSPFIAIFGWQSTKFDGRFE